MLVSLMAPLFPCHQDSFLSQPQNRQGQEEKKKGVEKEEEEEQKWEEKELVNIPTFGLHSTISQFTIW